MKPVEIREMKSPELLVELDREFSKYWMAEGLRVYEVDALKLNWDTLKVSPQGLLVSNLPYQISSRIVIDRSLGPDTLTYMVLMFQKEVAERIVAQPRTKAYGF